MDTVFFIAVQNIFLFVFIEALNLKGILHSLKKGYYVSHGMTLQLH